MYDRTSHKDYGKPGATEKEKLWNARNDENKSVIEPIEKSMSE